MFDTEEKFILVCVLIGIPLIIVAAFYCNSLTNSLIKEQHRLDGIECEKRGGIQLDRTYSYGKNSTGHMYTCVKKEMVIEYEFEH